MSSVLFLEKGDRVSIRFNSLENVVSAGRGEGEKKRKNGEERRMEGCCCCFGVWVYVVPPRLEPHRPELEHQLASLVFQGSSGSLPLLLLRFEYCLQSPSSSSSSRLLDEARGGGGVCVVIGSDRSEPFPWRRWTLISLSVHEESGQWKPLLSVGHERVPLCLRDESLFFFEEEKKRNKRKENVEESEITKEQEKEKEIAVEQIAKEAWASLQETRLIRLQAEGTSCYFSEIFLSPGDRKIELPTKPMEPQDAVAPASLLTGEERPLRSVAELLALDDELENVESIESGHYLPLIERKSENRPLVIACHDMKGGYGWDRLLDTGHHDSYVFSRWGQVDIFVYFSHHTCTIPPSSWIQICHKNNVKVFGTLIFEWDKGKRQLLDLFDQPISVALRMTALAKRHALDGWFLNVECALPDLSHRQALLSFATTTRRLMKQHLGPGAELIWYDSVTMDTGELKWQNELNSRNFAFFEATDGIFLNYAWKPPMLSKSAEEAGSNKHRVFAGIDVFGRTTYGGGGFGTRDAAQEIVSSGCSVALFAPGWVYELVEDTHLTASDRLWLTEMTERRMWEGIHFRNLLDNQQWDTRTEKPCDGWSKLDEKCLDGGTSGWVCSNKWCVRSTIVHLDAEVMKTAAFVDVSCWVRGKPPKCSDLFSIRVELRGSGDVLLEAFETGKMKCRSDGKWMLVQHTFSKNLSQAQKVFWEERGKDQEGWGGHFGTIFAGSNLSVKSFEKNQQPPPLSSLASLLSTRPKSVSRLWTSFNYGSGGKFWFDGSQVLDAWWQLLLQDLFLPFSFSPQILSQSYLDASLCFERGIFGGSCAHIKGKIEKGGPPILEVLIGVMEPSQLMDIGFSFDRESSPLCLLLRFGNGDSIGICHEDHLSAFAGDGLKLLPGVGVKVNHWEKVVMNQVTLPEIPAPFSILVLLRPNSDGIINSYIGHLAVLPTTLSSPTSFPSSSEAPESRRLRIFVEEDSSESGNKLSKLRDVFLDWSNDPQSKKDEKKDIAHERERELLAFVYREDVLIGITPRTNYRCFQQPTPSSFSVHLYHRSVDGFQIELILQSPNVC